MPSTASTSAWPALRAAPARTGSARIEARLDEITRDIAALATLLAPGEEPVPRGQERLTVTDS